MIFSVPTQTKEINTTFPIDAKSIRGMYFVKRKSTATDAVVNIDVDGYQICDNLIINPFCIGMRNFDDTTLSNFLVGKSDYRDYMIHINMNIKKSKLKISTNINYEDAFDVVFVLSDMEVENEHLEYIECNSTQQTKTNFILKYQPIGLFTTLKTQQNTVIKYPIVVKIEDNDSYMPFFSQSAIDAELTNWRQALWLFNTQTSEEIQKSVNITAENLQSTDKLNIYFYSHKNIIR